MFCIARRSDTTNLRSSPYFESFFPDFFFHVPPYHQLHGWVVNGALFLGCFFAVLLQFRISFTALRMALLVRSTALRIAPLHVLTQNQDHSNATLYQMSPYGFRRALFFSCCEQLLAQRLSLVGFEYGTKVRVKTKDMGVARGWKSVLGYECTCCTASRVLTQM